MIHPHSLHSLHSSHSLHFSPYPSSSSLSPSPPDLPMERKMKKPLMERRRRERINQSLTQLKEVLMVSAPQHSSKLEKADILEMTVEYLKKLQAQLTNGKTIAPSEEDASSIYRRGIQHGYSEASRAAFGYLHSCMPPPDRNPQSQQIHFGLVNHLRSSFPSSLPTSPPSLSNQKTSPLTPESLSSQSPSSPPSSLPRPIPTTPLSILHSPFVVHPPLALSTVSPNSSLPHPSTPLSSLSLPHTVSSPSFEKSHSPEKSSKMWQPWH